MFQGWMLPLFVPATRPERFAKAAVSGTDAVVIDLEDAVDAADKSAARQHLVHSGGLGIAVIVRVNAGGTEWHDEDLSSARRHAAAIMLPKAEDAAAVAFAHEASGLPIVALIETIAGLDNLAEIAAAKGVVQLALGTMDFAAELGCAPTSSLFDSVRLQMLAASGRAGLAAPLDGVCLAIDDAPRLKREAQAILANGFAGRLLIHPAQVGPTAGGLLPNEDELTFARAVAATSGGAMRVAGRMVDAPVRRSSRRILASAERIAAALSRSQH